MTSLDSVLAGGLSIKKAESYYYHIKLINETLNSNPQSTLEFLIDEHFPGYTNLKPCIPNSKPITLNIYYL